MKANFTPRRILDAVHRSRLAQLVPLLLALCSYALFLLTGADEQKLVLAIATPVICLLVYFLFAKVILQLLQDPRYADKFFPDLVFSLMTVIFALAALALLLQFLTDLQNGFTAGLPLSLVIWSAVSRVCHQRAAE